MEKPKEDKIGILTRLDEFKQIRDYNRYVITKKNEMENMKVSV